MNNIDVEKIYSESMLNIEDSEREITISKFNDVIKEVDSLFELDTEGVDCFEITSDVQSPLREDIPEESIDRELALSNTKHREYGYFKLGKVVE